MVFMKVVILSSIALLVSNVLITVCFMMAGNKITDTSALGSEGKVLTNATRAEIWEKEEREQKKISFS